MTFVKDVTVALAAAVVAALVSVTGFVVNQPPVASVRQANRGLAGGGGRVQRQRSLPAARDHAARRYLVSTHCVC